MKTNTFRLFISSTFSDFNEERQILQSKVFPHLKEYCESKGFNFQPIDLRWGVSNEAQLDQKALSLCIEEVQASKNTLHPNFLIMAGNRYGWVPLPYAIEQTEFESIRSLVMDEGLDIEYWKYKDDNGNEHQSSNRKCTQLELLNQWYQLDENQLPASYILQERKDLSQGDKSKDHLNYLIYENWGTEEEILTKMVQDAVNKTDLSGKDRDKYFTSATEQEVIEGIFNYSYETEYQKEVNSEDGNYKETDKSNVYAYLRNSSCDTELCNEKFEEEDNLKQKAKDFKDNIRDVVVDDNIYETSSQISSVSVDENNGSLNYKYKEIVSDEATEFETSMIRLLKQSIDRHEKIVAKDFDINQNQKDFKDDKLKGFIGREKDLEVISNYISGDNNQPLVIYGPSGMGKSALMAKAIDEADGSFDGDVVYRFVGSTPALNTSVDILISILAQMGIEHKIDKSIEDEKEAIKDFYVKTKTYLSDFKDNITIFIDAIDQVSNEDKMEWLPEIIPSNIKLIISAIKDTKYEEDSKYLVSLLGITINSYNLPPLKNPICVLEGLLNLQKRTLTSEQYIYVESIYKNIKTPLYLLIISAQVRFWRSVDTVNELQTILTDKTLPPTQLKAVNQYISSLSNVHHHPEELVHRVVSYIVISGGMSEEELVQVISSDSNFINRIAPDTYHTKCNQELPMSFWARLHTQLSPLLRIEIINNVHVMHFCHREFNLSIKNNLHELDKLALMDTFKALISEHQNYLYNSNRWGELFYKTFDRNFHIINDEINTHTTFFSKLDNELYIMSALLTPVSSQSPNAAIIIIQTLHNLQNQGGRWGGNDCVSLLLDRLNYLSGALPSLSKNGWDEAAGLLKILIIYHFEIILNRGLDDYYVHELLRLINKLDDMVPLKYKINIMSIWNVIGDFKSGSLGDKNWQQSCFTNFFKNQQKKIELELSGISSTIVAPQDKTSKGL